MAGLTPEVLPPDPEDVLRRARAWLACDLDPVTADIISDLVALVEQMQRERDPLRAQLERLTKAAQLFLVDSWPKDDSLTKAREQMRAALTQGALRRR
jgi:hypothetical protein